MNKLEQFLPQLIRIAEQDLILARKNSEVTIVGGKIKRISLIYESYNHYVIYNTTDPLNRKLLSSGERSKTIDYLIDNIYKIVTE